MFPPAESIVRDAIIASRLVTETAAAAYAGLDVATFRKWAATGKLPGALTDCGLYDLCAVDGALDQLSGLGANRPHKTAVESELIDHAIFFTVTELSVRWRLSEQSLANLRAKGEGLPFTKLPSGSIRYKIVDVLNAEGEGAHGFSWQALGDALKSFPGLSANMRADLITHARKVMK